jgi:hypothetical protein
MSRMATEAAMQAQGGVIRDLQRTMARANDAHIAEIVTLLDALPDRGAADALLAPLRGRLQQAWPPRSMTFSRLLFTPANAVVVPPAKWRRNGVTLPRIALRCLSAQVRFALGDTPDIMGALSAVSSSDCAGILRIGAILWPRAAEILASAPIPSDWSEQTGLTATDYVTIARPLAALLYEATSIEAFVDNAAAGVSVSRAQIRECLSRVLTRTGAAAKAPPPIGMLISVLLGRLPIPEDVLVVAGDLSQLAQNPSIRQASDLAIDMLLAGSETMLDGHLNIGMAADEIRRVLVLLDTLEKPGPACRPAQKQALLSLRRNLDTTCRKLFDQELGRSVLSARSGAGTAKQDAAVTELEATMRDLRAFEAAARGFGSGPSYDQAISAASRTLAAVPPDPESVSDVARLIEILDGPEAGLTFLLQFQSAAAAPA